MRMILMLFSVLLVSILIFKGYSSGFGHQNESQVETIQIDPRDKAREVNQIILDSTSAQKRQLEKQLQ